MGVIDPHDAGLRATGERDQRGAHGREEPGAAERIALLMPNDRRDTRHWKEPRQLREGSGFDRRESLRRVRAGHAGPEQLRDDAKRNSLLASVGPALEHGAASSPGAVRHSRCEAGLADPLLALDDEETAPRTDHCERLHERLELAPPADQRCLPLTSRARVLDRAGRRRLAGGHRARDLRDDFPLFRELTRANGLSEIGRLGEGRDS